MNRTSKVFLGSLVLLLAVGMTAAVPTPFDPPKVPKQKNLEATSDDGKTTELRPTLDVAVAAPIVPPIQTNSMSSGGGHASGLAGISGSMGSVGGGGASIARASVEKSLRRLTENLR